MYVAHAVIPDLQLSSVIERHTVCAYILPGAYLSGVVGCLESPVLDRRSQGAGPGMKDSARDSKGVVWRIFCGVKTYLFFPRSLKD